MAGEFRLQDRPPGDRLRVLKKFVEQHVIKWGEPVWRNFVIPLFSILLFLALWAQLSSRVHTSLGVLPGPVQVYEEMRGLWSEHQAQGERKAAFYTRQQERNAALQAADPAAKLVERVYTGKPSYVDQIFTSLKTVFMGFFLATLVAVPLGILCGVSRTASAAFNPMIQIFRPVSPLAWLPIVTMLVSALYVSDDLFFEKSFLTSAITVTLCSLWPTLINTSVGVASIDRDLLNVGRVLRLKWRVQLVRLVLPSALPFIFTGMRLSLGVGWMMLIAAEMLAQNPGLGKFVWDEFQNGSSHSLGRIMVAVFTIGNIGFLLDRLMGSLQRLVTFSDRR
ncbi:MAG: ABC transporter permease [Alphaproteobacteria bacterium]|nr:ABC transporter permease [Alphaproteobacteria bacterium]